MRHPYKGRPIEDLEKARWYLVRAIDDDAKRNLLSKRMSPTSIDRFEAQTLAKRLVHPAPCLSVSRAYGMAHAVECIADAPWAASFSGLISDAIRDLSVEIAALKSENVATLSRT